MTAGHIPAPGARVMRDGEVKIRVLTEIARSNRVVIYGAVKYTLYDETGQTEKPRRIGQRW